MNYLLLFTVSLWISGPLNVNCGLKNWIYGTPSPPPEESSLILMIETSGYCYLAKEEFVTNQMNKIYSKFLFACPPEPGSPEENLASFSTTNNPLFIEKIYDRPTSPGKNLERIGHKCRRPVYPSIVNIGRDESNPEVYLYLVGFEVFIDPDKYSYRTDDFPNVALRDPRFAWFHAYTIVFDHNKGNVVSVFSPNFSYKRNELDTYPTSAFLVRASLAELDYNLGMGIFYEQRTEINKIYGKENEEDVFKNLEVFNEGLNYVDLIQDRFLMEVHLAPLESFRTPVLRQAAQTFANIAPMWNIIYNNVWYNVEKYVEYLARGVKAIHVITGTYGTLQLSGKEIYLGLDNTVKVPAAFYKIVSYSPNPNEKYSIVIVTSNNPYDETDETFRLVCKKNKCLDFGWENIQQDSYGLGRTSCCEPTKEILKELKMKHYHQLIDKTLNLNEVPHWRVDNLTLDVKTYIKNQMDGKELDKEADDVIYRSFKNMEMGHEDEESTYSNFISIIYTNYIFPYFAGMRDDVDVSTAGGDMVTE